LSNISPLLNIFIKSIREIRKIVIRDFNEIEKLQSSLKNNYAFEQKSFHKTQEEITNILKKIKPNYEILENSNIFEKNCWVVDYRDYKFNFSRANDNLGIGVSLITENNLDLFVFYNPVKDEIFFFDKGQGAFKNDSRIRVSHRSKRNEIVVSVHKKLKKDDDKKVIKFLKNTFYENSLIQRETGSLFVDLCDLASGKIDCMIFSNPNEQIKLVVNLILSESGGNVNLLEHMNSNIYITGNNLVGKTIKEMIEINIKNDESFD
jgi:myo-inositol-1(or 4)-monophosphatase